MTDRTKRTIGHDTLRLALEHERTCWNDFSGRYGQTRTAMQNDVLQARYEAADNFLKWAMAEYRRQYSGESS